MSPTDESHVERAKELLRRVHKIRGEELARNVKIDGEDQGLSLDQRFVYRWQDRDDDVEGSIEAWEPDMHPFIVGVLRLATTEDASAGQTTAGIYISDAQARDLAAVLTELADAHVAPDPAGPTTSRSLIERAHPGRSHP